MILIDVIQTHPEPKRKFNWTLAVLILVAAVVSYFFGPREELRTFTEPMGFFVTNDVIYFIGSDRQFAETNAEWARGLQDVSGETAFVTIHEIWVRGRRVRWRVEGVTKQVVTVPLNSQ